MAINNVAQFAAELNMPSDVLLKQLRDAGVEKRSVNDVLSKEDRGQVAESFAQCAWHAERRKTQDFADSQGNERNRAEADASGKSRTIQVEVRKKRTFVKRDEQALRSEIEQRRAAASVIDEAEKQRRAEEARRQAS